MVSIVFKFGNYYKTHKPSRDNRIFYFEQMPTYEEFIERVRGFWGYYDMESVDILEIRE